ncbi:MAG: MBL fold metallo-hydrolase [Candidatus Thorarchaeota archaeon]
MVDALRVRAYNVGLGDCILVTIPAGRERRHILIDFGSTRGKDKPYLSSVLKNVLEEVSGDPLAVVLSHGHMDHFKGLHNHLAELDPVTKVFLTTQHLRTSDTIRAGTRDGPILKALDGVLKDIKSRLRAEGADEETRSLAEERILTDQMLDELCRGLGGRVRYLSRGTRGVLSPFLRGTGADIGVLAPEQDGSVYAERVFSKILPARERTGLLGSKLANAIRDRMGERVPIRDLLMAEREYDNSTSLVFVLTWRGKRLLFPGDAELPSWETMYRNGLLGPVDLLKVAHHASVNGTPLGLPELWSSMVDPDRRPKFLVSTYPRKDWNIPDRNLLRALGGFGQVVTTEGVDGHPGFVDISLS